MKFLDVFIAFISFMLMVSGLIIGVVALVDFNETEAIMALLMISLSWAILKIYRIMRRGYGM